jgi:hypothetical protein
MKIFQQFMQLLMLILRKFRFKKVNFRTTDHGLSVTDDATGIKVGFCWFKKWDTDGERLYFFSEGKMIVCFGVGVIRRRVHIDGGPRHLAHSVHIMEKHLKTNFLEERKKNSKPPLTEKEYQRYLKIIAKGMYALFKVDNNFTPDFKVCFEPDPVKWRKSFCEWRTNFRSQIEQEKSEN